ncbi:16S rRNA (guanine(527)-N(7))-methyltransferase RsmG [Thermodesulfobacteriota bacterium]
MQIDSLCEYADKYNVALTDVHIQKFSLFLGCLEEWNSKMNLVGTSDRDRIITELLLDSLIPAPFLPSAGSMVDIGSGAGFPGVIIKVLKPGISVRLIESSGKKVSFLKYVIRELQLKNVTAINKRVETIVGSLNNEEINLITSRAMTDLHSLIKLCGSILTPGGKLIGFLGSKWKKELEKNEKIIRESNLFIDNSLTYKLPEKSNERAVVFLKKE